MKLSKASKNDYDELIQVWEASVSATHHFVSEEDIQNIKTSLSQYFDAVDLVLIHENGRIIGFMGTSDEEIQMLFLHPDGIGKGIGKFLIQFAIDERGAKKVEVNEQNEHAVNFYKKMGFEVYDRLETDQLGKPYPLLLMKRAHQMADGYPI